MKTNLELQTRIRAAYILGMGLLIAFMVASYFLIDTRIQNREKDANLIYSIAQQRMGSQHILLLATRLDSPASDAVENEVRQKRAKAIAAMRASHGRVVAQLRHPDARHSYQKVQAIYFEGPTLRDELEHYLADVTRVGALRDYRQVSRQLGANASLRKKAPRLLANRAAYSCC